MSYYGEKSADNILKDIVICELNEFSCGASVTSPNLASFTKRKVLKNLGILAAIFLFSLVSMWFHLFLGALVFVIYNLSKYFKGNRLVYFIMSEAKKMPDKKISTIISEQCVRGEPLPDGSFPFETTPTSTNISRIKKPIIITLCSVVGVALLTGIAYLFIPITLYEDVEGGCAVTYARTGIMGRAEVEAYHDGKAVVGIKSGAYKNNIFLQHIEFPYNLKFIEGEAFMNCLFLREITIPPEVTELRGDTFHGCRGLRDVTLHDDITAIHASCFMECESITRITLPKNITEIHESTFNNCNHLIAIEIPEGVTRIAARAFFSCDSLTEVSLPDSLNDIGSSAFRSCERLRKIEIPEGCFINERAFKDSPTEIEYF